MHQHDHDMLIATTSHHLISPLISFLLVISFSLSFLRVSLLPPIVSCLSMSRLSSCLSDPLCSRCFCLPSFSPSFSSSPQVSCHLPTHMHTHTSYCPSLPPSPVSVPCSLLLLPPPPSTVLATPAVAPNAPDAPLPYPQYVPPPAQPRPVSNSWLHLSLGPHSTCLCAYHASLIFRSPSPALGFWILRLRCRLRLVSCGLSYAR